MSRDLLRAQLKRDKGSGPQKLGRFLPYRCTAGKLTIGYGHNLDDNGLKQKFVDAVLDDDIDDVIKELVVKFPWFEALDPARQAVLVNMGFMGVPKLAGFRKMLAAAQRGEYATAAVEMLASDWADQVGARAWRLATQMETGRWQ